MQILVSRSGRRLVAGLCAAAAVAAAVPAGASASPVAADLRVDADGQVLAPGYRYVTDTTRLQTDQRSGCGGSGDVKTLKGPTALGILDTASRLTPPLRPLSVSDRFSFGLFVCGIGAFTGDATRFWLYKVDHKAPEVGADQFRLTTGDEVLWYFQDTDKNVNTGDELSIVAPARTRSGQTFAVTVYVYDAAGRRRPAAGALVFGETVQRTNANGQATIFSSKEGYLRLRAGRGSDIPSGPVNICLNEVLTRCPAVRGERIFGTSGRDRITGTPGADRIDARGGRDRVNVRRGGRDRVHCGSGRDFVRAGRGDRIARDCEVVRRR